MTQTISFEMSWIFKNVLEFLERNFKKRFVVKVLDFPKKCRIFETQIQKRMNDPEFAKMYRNFRDTVSKTIFFAPPERDLYLACALQNSLFQKLPFPTSAKNGKRREQ